MRGSRSGGIAGSSARPTRHWERIEAFAAAGAQRIMLQDFLPRDLEMVALLGRIAAG